MIASVFITGTDTGVGKTLVSASLLAALNGRGIAAVGMKPVASGCTMSEHGLRNADAELLIAHSRPAPAYDLVNPFAFAEPIAPHLAALAAGRSVQLEPIRTNFAALSTNAQCVIVEGVGGWCVPLSEQWMQADMVRALQLPVILVVGLRLGCINHALLSARAICADGSTLLGWIGNRIDPAMEFAEGNLHTLRAHLHAPCLGVLPHATNADPSDLATHLDAACAALGASA